MATATTTRGSPAQRYAFDPEAHAAELVPILEEIAAAAELDEAGLDRILRRHPKGGRGFFGKSEILRGFRHFVGRGLGLGIDEATFVARVMRKPVRTLSGVAPVTVLTRPHPCPGRCIFCPSDVSMPKSYLADEPGCQRAADNAFDPYRQTFARLLALHHTGHRLDKVELLVLGGTWSSYPEGYRVWFLERCLAALNAFRPEDPELPPAPADAVDFAALAAAVDARELPGGYNHLVGAYLRRTRGGLAGEGERASTEALETAQRANETAHARLVGLTVETRPDHVSAAEILHLRRLGVTRVQLGLQSLSDAVLAANRRGHDVAASRRAVARLRRAGFKVLAHWMANLHGSDPERDAEDFARLFDDPDFRPDELKVYPTSLIASAELMAEHEAGRWRPYTHDELLELLVAVLPTVPPWCRISRVIRDIPGGDIVTGNKTTNLRQVVEDELARRGRRVVDIRSREIRDTAVDPDGVRLEALRYDAGVAREVFLQAVTAEDRLAGFLRLSLPRTPAGEGLGEIAGSAMIREVHVYGRLAALEAAGEATAQHRGLGRRLVARAARLARRAGFRDLAVIASVGTRPYYRRLGFTDGRLYQHRRLG